MDYIKRFDKHSEYESFKNSENYTMPNVSYCEGEETPHYNSEWDYKNQYFTIKCLTAGSVAAVYDNITFDTSKFYYSTDNGETWINDINFSELFESGDKIIFKCTDFHVDENINSYFRFNTTAQIEVSGNIMSLIYGDKFENHTHLSSTHTFRGIFTHNSNLISAKNLILPATTLTYGCYESMFDDCENLTTPPKMLPATTLAEGCYSGMFSYCTSLTTAPALPATTLTVSCYDGMFSYCTSLTTAPALPATTLTSDCYRGMFQGCTSLNFIKAEFTTAPSDTYTYNWVDSVAASGIFLKSSNASWDVTGVNGVPEGWVVSDASDDKFAKRYELLIDEQNNISSIIIDDLTDDNLTLDLISNAGAVASSVDLPIVSDQLAGILSAEQYNDLTENGINFISVEYGELETLKANDGLIEGKWYRINDYTATTVQDGTQSAGNRFDILVMATSNNTLNETAKAMKHGPIPDGNIFIPDYFGDCNLDAWEIKYCFENDTDRFHWADDTNGKGVIYYMKDEWGNECPYDFKNIMFTRPLTDGELDTDNGTNTSVYTFNLYRTDTDVIEDASIVGNTLTNDEGHIDGVYGNKMGVVSEYAMYTDQSEFEHTQFVLNNNVFLTLGEDGDYYGCYSNTFGVDCYNNTFGNECYNNTFGGWCLFNTFGESCQNNTFGKDYTQYVIIENGNKYITLTSTQTTSVSDALRNIKISQGVNNTTSTKTISHNTLNDTFQTIYQAANSTIVNV